MDSNDDQVWLDLMIWNPSDSDQIYQDVSLYSDPLLVIAELEKAIAAVEQMMESTA